jgi:hypothetical protein
VTSFSAGFSDEAGASSFDSGAGATAFFFDASDLLFQVISCCSTFMPRINFNVARKRVAEDENTYKKKLTAKFSVSLNTMILMEIKRNQKKRAAMTTSTMSKSDEKATKLLLVVSSTYVLLVLPLGLIQSTELIWNNSQKVSETHPDYIDFMMTKIRLKWARAFFFFFYQLFWSDLFFGWFLR